MDYLINITLEGRQRTTPVPIDSIGPLVLRLSFPLGESYLRDRLPLRPGGHQAESLWSTRTEASASGTTRVTPPADAAGKVADAAPARA